MQLGNVLITGGTGFIGSNLIEPLIPLSDSINIVDKNISDELVKHMKKKKVYYIQCDFKDVDDLIYDVDTVFHLAAYPDVKTDFIDPLLPINENFNKTVNLLEMLRKIGRMETFVFTSTSTVYGEANQIPTKEDYGPLLPISSYGASKLACEGIISSYASNYGFDAKIFRLANIVGPNNKKGVIYDLYKKLRSNSNGKLEVLGNGFQTKSYLHVKDCVKGIITGTLADTKNKVDIFNLGNIDTLDVHKIADIMLQSFGLDNIRVVTRNTIGEGRGWKGDVTYQKLDIEKIKALGWTPSLNSYEAVLSVIKEMQ